jgi:hypothetical protein
MPLTQKRERRDRGKRSEERHRRAAELLRAKLEALVAWAPRRGGSALARHAADCTTHRLSLLWTGAPDISNLEAGGYEA